MYLNVGNDIILPVKNLIAIIGWTNKEIIENDINIEFIKMIKERGIIMDTAKGKIKSLILTDNDKVYLSSISKQTLTKRSIRNEYSGGEKKID